MDKFYVYAYLDLDGTPFYIGKGCDKRRDNHIRLCRHPETRNDCPDFYAKLREMLDSGTRPERITVLESLPLIDARQWEKALIDEIGRIDLGTGPLTNLTDGSKPGPKTRQRMSKATAKWHASLTPEEKQNWLDAVSAGFEGMTPEEKQHWNESQSKVKKATWEALTPKEKQREAEVRRATYAAISPEEKKQTSEALSKAQLARHARATTEEKKRRATAISKGHANRTPEEKKTESENRSKAAKAAWVKIKTGLTS